MNSLFQVRSLQENDGGISVQAVGRQRCRILNRRSAINGYFFSHNYPIN